MNHSIGASSTTPARISRIDGWQSREADSEEFVVKSAIHMLAVVLTLVAIVLAFQLFSR
jgi:hypothetical protein